MSRGGAARATGILVITLGVVTLIFGASSLILPFGRDQLCYAFIGDAMLHGKTLYRDVPIIQLPMTGVVHALALLVFGRSMSAIRIMDLLWTYVTGAFVLLLVRRILRRDGEALIAACLYVVIYYELNYWSSAQVDGFLNLPVCAGLYFGTRAVPGPPSLGGGHAIGRGAGFQLVAAGVLFSVAILFKYTIALVIPALLTFLLLANWPRLRPFWEAMAWLSVGTAIPLATFVVALAVSGGLGDFIFQQLHAALPYARLDRLRPLADIKWFWIWYPFKGRYGIGVCLDVLGAAVAAWALRRSSPVAREMRLALLLLLMWLGAAFFSTFIQRKFFDYHYLTLVPPLAILRMVALTALFRVSVGPGARAGVRPILFALVLGDLTLAMCHYDRVRDLVRVGFDRASVESYWLSDAFHDPTFSTREQIMLSRYLGEHTASTDRITCLGIDPSLSFPLWREPVMRYSLRGSQDPRTWALDPAFAEHPPDVIIVPHGDRIPWVRGHDMDSHEELMVFVPMRDFVATRYEQVASVGRFAILRLTKAQGSRVE